MQDIFQSVQKVNSKFGLFLLFIDQSRGAKKIRKAKIITNLCVVGKDVVVPLFPFIHDAHVLAQCFLPVQNEMPDPFLDLLADCV